MIFPRRIPPALLAAIGALTILSLAIAMLLHARGAAPVPAASAGATASSRSPEAAIARARASLADDPDDAAALGTLATAAFIQAGATGDPAWLVTSERAATRAVTLQPRDFSAMDVLGRIALTRHQFADALGWSRRSLAVAPTRVAPVEIRADALVELGRYDAAFTAVQRRLALRPDLPAYSRASYALELQGDRAGATRLMEMAAAAGGAGSSDRAWALAHLGLLRFGDGDLDGAERDMRTALAEVPGDADATAGLARVLSARGDLAGAEGLLDEAIAGAPSPELLAERAEVHGAMGNGAAERADAEAAASLERRIAGADGNVDLEVAVLRADVGVPPARDVALAIRDRGARPGVSSDAALGWVLTRAGRCAEADGFATRSLRLGTRDPLMLFRAGMAASCNARPAVARQRLTAALALNPAFSPRWAPVARRELARLPG
jgi:tetratricopeptide (TPR) repeat protein